MNALILIGGKSSRMGIDKSRLVYYQKPQYQHIFDLLRNFFPKENIYFSVSKKHNKIEGQVIEDIYPDLGPFSAIYSALKKNNRKSWLVLAIDIPYINYDLLNILIKGRDTLKIATAFQGIAKKYPEPLITIWEPKALVLLEENLKCENYSLVSILKNHPIKTILIDDKTIENVNTIRFYKKVKKDLEK